MNVRNLGLVFAMAVCAVVVCLSSCSSDDSSVRNDSESKVRRFLTDYYMMEIEGPNTYFYSNNTFVEEYEVHPEYADYELIDKTGTWSVSSDNLLTMTYSDGNVRHCFLTIDYDNHVCTFYQGSKSWSVDCYPYGRAKARLGKVVSAKGYPHYFLADYDGTYYELFEVAYPIEYIVSKGSWSLCRNELPYRLKTSYSYGLKQTNGVLQKDDNVILSNAANLACISLSINYYDDVEFSTKYNRTSLIKIVNESIEKVNGGK